MLHGGNAAFAKGRLSRLTTPGVPLELEISPLTTIQAHLI
jgi:hypothetical protein